MLRVPTEIGGRGDGGMSHQFWQKAINSCQLQPLMWVYGWKKVFTAFIYNILFEVLRALTSRQLLGLKTIYSKFTLSGNSEDKIMHFDVKVCVLGSWQALNLTHVGKTFCLRAFLPWRWYVQLRMTVSPILTAGGIDKIKSRRLNESEKKIDFKIFLQSSRLFFVTKAFCNKGAVSCHFVAFLE